MTELRKRVAEFGATMPHLSSEYSNRLWGHRLHSLCSYQGKFRPALAHVLIKAFTEPGWRVLDPLAGVGTIPFEASLLGRTGVANDKSPLAAIVSAGKMKPMNSFEAQRALERFEKRFESETLTESDYSSAEFGLNSSVKDYYHPDTLSEVLKARKVLLQNGPDGDEFLWASLLHILHGNRPYALSRTSHPITPFAPKGEFVYKSLLNSLRRRVEATADLPLPATFHGESYDGDFRDLAEKLSVRVDAVITSPPFMGMRFDRPNWLRMWFCGWEERDFHLKSLGFLERQQVADRDCYSDFFFSCHAAMRCGGTLVVHVGSGSKGNLSEDLKARAAPSFEYVDEILEDSTNYQKHGLKDKGLTKVHHLLFFTKA